MKQRDTYSEVKVIESTGMIVRVHIPDITTEERAKRMKAVYDAAASLLKGERNRGYT